MIIFRTMRDLQQLQQDDPAYSVVRACLQRTAHLDGYLILVEEEIELDLPELKGRLVDISWDGISKIDDYFHAVYLTNNEFALEFIIKDTHQLNAELRQSLEIQALD